jgi:hypothetical protein
MNKKISSFLLILFFFPLVANCASMLDAVEANNLAKVQGLTDKGEDLNKTSECTAPLVLAAEKGHKEMVQLLLSKGADPNIRLPECKGRHKLLGAFRKSGHTALYWASNSEITRILLEKGADPNLSGTKEFMSGDVDLDLPLEKALIRKDYEMTALLLSHGANPNIYRLLDGKNQLLWIISVIEKKDPALAGKFNQLFVKYKAHDLDISENSLRKTDAKIMKSYKNNRTGDITVMDDEIASKLYNTPGKLSPITFDIKQNKYFHDFEFSWVENGQNLYEWYILRRLSKKMK